MILSRVIGNAVSTTRHPAYDARTVLVCQPVTPDGHRALGSSFLAVDSVQAGVGDLVLVAREGNAARQVLGGDADPLHSVVLAVVDQVVHGASVATGPGP